VKTAETAAKLPRKLRRILGASSDVAVTSHFGFREDVGAVVRWTLAADFTRLSTTIGNSTVATAPRFGAFLTSIVPP